MGTRQLATRAILLSTIALWGCDDLDYGRFDQLDRPRVLGMRATPQALPEGGGQLDALVWTPDDRELTYTWRWCPLRTLARDQYVCPITREEYITLIDEVALELLDLELEDEFFEAIPPFELGSDPSPMFAHQLDGEEAEGVCFLALVGLLNRRLDLQESLQSFECELGFEIDIVVEVKGGDWSTTSKKSVFIETLAEPLTNPRIDAIVTRPIGAQSNSRLDWPVDPETEESAWVPIEEATLARGFQYEIRAAMDPESVDIIIPPTPDNPEDKPIEVDPKDLRAEYFDYGWYATRDVLSEVAFGGTYFKENDPDDEDALVATNTLDLTSGGERACANTSGPCAIEIILVVRDEQFGIDWRRLELEISEVAR